MFTSPNDVMVCGLPFSRISKSSRGQVGDDVASRIGDRGVDFDRLDLDAERRLLRRLSDEHLRAAHYDDERGGDSWGH